MTDEYLGSVTRRETATVIGYPAVNLSDPNQVEVKVEVKITV